MSLLTKADLTTFTAMDLPYCNTKSPAWYHSSETPASCLVTSRLHSTQEGEQFILTEINTTHIMGIGLPLLLAWPLPAPLSESSPYFIVETGVNPRINYFCVLEETLPDRQVDLSCPRSTHGSKHCVLGGSSICNCSTAQTEQEHRETEISRATEMNLIKILCSSTEL